MKVSVITATYNCASVIKDCIDSVGAQSYPDIDHVVVDGASDDGTLEILRRHERQFSVLRSEQDCGIYDALNKGIALARGEVVGFLHADDLLASPQALERIASIFAADDTVSAVYGDLNYVQASDASKIVRHWRSSQFSPRSLFWGWMPPHPTLYVRKQWYEKIGGFDTSYKIAGDYRCVLQLFSDPSFKSAYLPEVLVLMRTGGASNRSIAAVYNKSREDWRALRASGCSTVSALITLSSKNLSKIKQFA